MVHWTYRSIPQQEIRAGKADCPQARVHEQDTIGQEQGGDEARNRGDKARKKGGQARRRGDEARNKIRLDQMQKGTGFTRTGAEGMRPGTKKKRPGTG